MEPKKRTALNEQIYEEAGEWFLEFRDGEPTAAARAEFDIWVRRSPDHMAAYLEIAAIWNEAPSLGSPEKSALIARASCDTENVVTLGQRNTSLTGTARSYLRSGFSSRQSVKVAAIFAFGVGVAASMWWLNHPLYATGIGEQRTIALKDGSRVQLNSRSRLKIHYSERERSMELLDGQALFTVAKDHNRPFVVSSGNTRVRAVGTQFDVYRKATGTVVTVVEGRVAVRDEPNPLRLAGLKTGETSLQPVLISAGQQLVVTRSEIMKPVVANVENVTAWRQQLLAFDAASLAEVAEEFNRYNERQFVIRDSGAFEFRISGVFSSSDPAGLIRFLRDRPNIRVLESSSKIIVERM